MSPPTSTAGAPSTKNATEHGRFGRVRVRLVVDRDRLHRCAEHIREQHELLPARVGDVTRGGQELDAGAPLLLGQACLAQKAVEVAHKRLEHELQPRVRRLPERLEHCRDQRRLARLLLSHAQEGLILHSNSVWHAPRPQAAGKS
jgi:hypothetical protein